MICGICRTDAKRAFASKEAKALKSFCGTTLLAVLRDGRSLGIVFNARQGNGCRPFAPTQAERPFR
ncbi:hypothetical protein A7X67_11610 [Clostridium sp. W14A]|nr:hypothetical protein A7X67_11610 [Clostridium sp. W14A]